MGLQKMSYWQGKNSPITFALVQINRTMYPVADVSLLSHLPPSFHFFYFFFQMHTCASLTCIATVKCVVLNAADTP